MAFFDEIYNSYFTAVESLLNNEIENQKSIHDQKILKAYRDEILPDVKVSQENIFPNELEYMDWIKTKESTLFSQQGGTPSEDTIVKSRLFLLNRYISFLIEQLEKIDHSDNFINKIKNVKNFYSYVIALWDVCNTYDKCNDTVKILHDNAKLIIKILHGFSVCQHNLQLLRDALYDEHNAIKKVLNSRFTTSGKFIYKITEMFSCMNADSVTAISVIIPKKEDATSRGMSKSLTVLPSQSPEQLILLACRATSLPKEPSLIYRFFKRSESHDERHFSEKEKTGHKSIPELEKKLEQLRLVIKEKDNEHKASLKNLNDCITQQETDLRIFRRENIELKKMLEELRQKNKKLEEKKNKSKQDLARSAETLDQLLLYNRQISSSPDNPITGFSPPPPQLIRTSMDMIVRRKPLGTGATAEKSISFEHDNRFLKRP